MNRISAVICELNPAHEGHKYIFDQARETGDTVIAVMSGNFVQRGENAIYDKYKRAETALSIGADLVVELPFPWCSCSAQYFAAASVSIAERLGADALVFGSECGDLNALQKAAGILKRKEFNSAIPSDERAAEFRERLLYEIEPDLPEGLLSSANDILGIEYIKNIKKMRPVPIKRISCHSASSIRAEMSDNREENVGAVFFDKLSELEFINMRLQREPSFDYAECGGGVGERLYKSAITANSAAEMFEIAKTKQYTNARLRRSALFQLMEVKNIDINSDPMFTFVLGFNEKGREYLSSIRNNKKIAVITKPSSVKELSEDARSQASLSMYADSIFSMLSEDAMTFDHFIRCSPVIKL